MTGIYGKCTAILGIGGEVGSHGSLREIRVEISLGTSQFGLRVSEIMWEVGNS